ncbi:rhodopsin family protein [Aspergillus clavatus NRRL 1]|uniref:Uncharacterized protein n=1 Tax=Aspergillus clavatus (strain ATCC 1007 / CBS 513.65 / DSM 816 / NCTC 3887 / NRRL 1 / QM 1276 / 107) TaxID=344612 RepID=A1CRH7_ASPCL|nr:uncharacterized protein ACLA_029810 [Aspergillus clavatus NRRL 1]EAW08248.1 hypothetical protein ACLA_029810 [Aspergillus clavatus NRRL 1]
MAICITFGTHEFTSMLEGYENVRAYCYNCVPNTMLNLNLHSINIADKNTQALVHRLLHSLYPTSDAQVQVHRKSPAARVAIHKTFGTFKPSPTLMAKGTIPSSLSNHFNSDRPDITPDTRPPQGVPPGPAPPPQAYNAAGGAWGGYPPQGYPQQGYPPQGYPPQGQPQSPPPQQNYAYK